METEILPIRIQLTDQIYGQLTKKDFARRDFEQIAILVGNRVTQGWAFLRVPREEHNRHMAEIRERVQWLWQKDGR